MSENNGLLKIEGRTATLLSILLFTLYEPSSWSSDSFALLNPLLRLAPIPASVGFLSSSSSSYSSYLALIRTSACPKNILGQVYFPKIAGCIGPL